MTQGDRIRAMTNEELAEWMEDFAEAYVCFWIIPGDQCDFSHREQDKLIQLDMLNSEYNDTMPFEL